MKRLPLILLLVLSLSQAAFAQYDKDVFDFRGRKALSEGKYSEAIGLFNILSRLDSTDCWTFFYRGIAKYNLGDLRGAYTDFNTSVRLNPVFTNGYHFRATDCISAAASTTSSPSSSTRPSRISTTTSRKSRRIPRLS